MDLSGSKTESNITNECKENEQNPLISLAIAASMMPNSKHVNPKNCKQGCDQESVFLDRRTCFKAFQEICNVIAPDLKLLKNKDILNTDEQKAPEKPETVINNNSNVREESSKSLLSESISEIGYNYLQVPIPLTNTTANTVEQPKALVIDKDILRSEMLRILPELLNELKASGFSSEDYQVNASNHHTIVSSNNALPKFSSCTDNTNNHIKKSINNYRESTSKDINETLNHVGLLNQDKTAKLAIDTTAKINTNSLSQSRNTSVVFVNKHIGTSWEFTSAPTNVVENQLIFPEETQSVPQEIAQTNSQNISTNKKEVKHINSTIPFSRNQNDLQLQIFPISDEQPVKNKQSVQVPPAVLSKPAGTSACSSFEKQDLSENRPILQVSSKTFSNLTPDEIVAEKCIDGKTYYQILWVGTTWDEESELLSNSKMTLLLTQYLQKKRCTASLPMQDKTKIFDSTLRTSDGSSGKSTKTQRVFSSVSAQSVVSNDVVSSIKEVESNEIMKENIESRLHRKIDVEAVRYNSNDISLGKGFKIAKEPILMVHSNVNASSQQTPIPFLNQIADAKSQQETQTGVCIKNQLTLPNTPTEKSQGTNIKNLKKYSTQENQFAKSKTKVQLLVTQIKNPSENVMYQTLNDKKTDNQTNNNSINFIPVQYLLLKDEEFKHKDFTANVLKNSNPPNVEGPSKMIQCKYCSKFYNSEQYELHEQLLSKYICQICNVRECNPQKLRKHIITHAKTWHKCSHCFKLFSTKKGYLIHRQSHLQKRNHTMKHLLKYTNCTKPWKGVVSLKWHEQKYCSNPEVVQVLHKCNVCKKQFSNDFLLKKHVVLHKVKSKQSFYPHRNKQGYNCKQDSSTFKQDSSTCKQDSSAGKLAKRLNKRINFWNRFTNKQYFRKSVKFCVMCIIGFKNPELFYKHINSKDCVIVKNSDQCMCCKQFFSSLESLMTHVTTCFKDSLVSLLRPLHKVRNKNTVLKPDPRHAVYHCSKCSTFLSSSYMFKVHNKLLHLKQEYLFCSLCPFKCFSQNLLSKHIETKQCAKPLSFCCFICDENGVQYPKFGSLSSLIQHLKSHKIPKILPVTSFKPSLKPAAINEFCGKLQQITKNSKDKKASSETLGLCKVSGFSKYTLQIVGNDLEPTLDAKKFLKDPLSKQHHQKNHFKCFSCLSEHQSHNLVLNHFQKIHNWTASQFFVCKNCKMVFKDEISLSNHHIEPGKCNILDLNQNDDQKKEVEKESLVQNKDKLITSQNTEKMPEVYVCVYCDLPFFTEHRVNTHNCHIPMTCPTFKVVLIDYACIICKKKIDINQGIQAHCASHSAAIFECYYCNLKVLSKCKLKRHFDEEHKKSWEIKMEDWVTEIQNDADEIVLDQIYHKKLHPADKSKSDFKCQSCLLVFFHAETLKNHMLYVCKDKPTNKWKGVSLEEKCCPECQKSFFNETSFLHHCLQSHSVVFKLKCPVCSKLSVNTKEMLKHISNDHNLTNQLWVSEFFEKPETVAHFQGTNRCTCCLSIFSDNISLLQHMFSHVDIKTEICNACGKFFVNLQELKLHVYTHHKCFFCECCRRMLHTVEDLYFHSQLHVLELNIPRDENGKMIVEVQENSGPEANEKLFPNDNTEQPLFSTSQKVKRDILEDDRLFHCYVCRKNIEGELTFIVHIKMHPIARQLFCLICNRNFDESSDLEKHLSRHFDKNMNFSEDFNDVNTLLEYEKEDFFKCKICYEVFDTEEEMLNHKLGMELHNFKMKSFKKANNISIITKRYYNAKENQRVQNQSLLDFDPYVDWQLASKYDVRKIFQWKFAKLSPVCHNLSVSKNSQKKKKSHLCKEKLNKSSFKKPVLTIDSIDFPGDVSIDIRESCVENESAESMNTSVKGTLVNTINSDIVKGRVKVPSLNLINGNIETEKNVSNEQLNSSEILKNGEVEIVTKKTLNTICNYKTEEAMNLVVKTSDVSGDKNTYKVLNSNMLNRLEDRENVSKKIINGNKIIKESHVPEGPKISPEKVCSNLIDIKHSGKILNKNKRGGRSISSHHIKILERHDGKIPLFANKKNQKIDTVGLEFLNRRERNLRAVLILADGSNNTCKFCGWKFPTFEGLKCHLLKHIDHPSDILIDYESRDVCCVICSSLVRKTSLKIHLKLKHSNIVDQYGQVKPRSSKSKISSERNEITQVSNDQLNSKKDAEIIDTLLKKKSQIFYTQPTVMPYPYTCTVCNRGYFHLSPYLSHFKKTHPWLYEIELEKFPKAKEKKQLKPNRCNEENENVVTKCAETFKAVLSDNISDPKFKEEIPNLDLKTDKLNDLSLSLSADASSQNLEFKSVVPTLSVSNSETNENSELVNKEHVDKFNDCDSGSEIEEITDEEIVESSSDEEASLNHLSILPADKKEIKCKLCDLIFLSKLELNNHFKSHKTNQKNNLSCPYFCLFCGFVANESSTLKHHLQNKHKNLYTKDLELSTSFINRSIRSQIPNALDQRKPCQIDATESVKPQTNVNATVKRSSGRKRNINPNVEDFLKSKKKKREIREENNVTNLLRTIRDVRIPILSSYKLPQSIDTEYRGKSRAGRVQTKKTSVINYENDESNNEFPCKFCGVILNSLSQLRVHKKNHSKGFNKSKEYFNKLRCCVCSSLIPRYDLKWHMHAVHDKESGIKLKNKRNFCKLCKYSTKHSLEEHTVKKHPQALKVECKLCDQRFPSTISYEKHFQSTHGNIIDETGLICYLCNKTFEDLADLHHHYSVTHMEKKSDLCCKTCNKFFYTQSDLSKHKTEFHNSDKFECGLCMLEFNDVKLCEAHVVVHKKVTEFKCTACNFYFDSNKILMQHASCCHAESALSTDYASNGEKKDLCAEIRSTKMRDKVENAEIKGDIDNVINKCIKCDETFIRQEIFLAHMKKVHSV